MHFKNSARLDWMKRTTTKIKSVDDTSVNKMQMNQVSKGKDNLRRLSFPCIFIYW